MTTKDQLRCFAGLIICTVVIMYATTCAAGEPKSVRRMYSMRDNRDMKKLNIATKPGRNGLKMTGETITLPELFIGDFEVSIEVIEKTAHVFITAHGETIKLKGGKVYTVVCKAGYLYASIYPKRYTSPIVPGVKIGSLRSKLAIRASGVTLKMVKVNKGVVE